MEVSRAICCVGVIWVACLRSGRGIERVDDGSEWGDCFGIERREGWSGKWAEFGKEGRGPPSRERETWTLVSLVSREMVASRRGKGSEEPIIVGCSLTRR